MANWEEYFQFNDQANYEDNYIHTNATEGGVDENDNKSSYYVDETTIFETNTVFSSRKELVDWVQKMGRRRSCSSPKKNVGQDTLNYQEPSRHSCYVDNKYHRHPYINQLPNIFHPYIIDIQDVKPDGNCGFRAIAASLGSHEDTWPTVRYDLMQEMMTYKLEYGQMFGIEECFNIYNTLDFFDTENGAPEEKWLDMPDMGVIVASKYNIVLHVLSMGGSSTYLTLRSPPIPWYERVVIVIAHVNGNHWVKVSLSGQYPVPTIVAYWRHHRHECAAGWVTMYKNQLDDYDRYLAHCFGGTRDKIVLE